MKNVHLAMLKYRYTCYSLFIVSISHINNTHTHEHTQQNKNEKQQENNKQTPRNVVEYS